MQEQCPTVPSSSSPSTETEVEYVADEESRVSESTSSDANDVGIFNKKVKQLRKKLNKHLKKLGSEPAQAPNAIGDQNKAVQNEKIDGLEKPFDEHKQRQSDPINSSEAQAPNGEVDQLKD